jgi:hypothetical protein
VLNRTYYTPGSGFGSWECAPGAKVTGTPVAVCNPVTHSIDIVAMGTDGFLNYTWWDPARGFGTRAYAYGSRTTGSPTAVYNPDGRVFETFAIGTDRIRNHTWWSLAGGFGGWDQAEGWADAGPDEVERLETAYHRILMGTDDAREGPSAWSERRTPRWSGTVTGAWDRVREAESAESSVQENK